MSGCLEAGCPLIALSFLEQSLPLSAGLRPLRLPSVERRDHAVDVRRDVLGENEEQADAVQQAQQDEGTEGSQRFPERPTIHQAAQQPPVPCGKYCETPKLSHIAHKDEKERMLRAIAIARVSARRRALRTATQADQTSRTGTSQVLTPIQCSVQ